MKPTARINISFTSFKRELCNTEKLLLIWILYLKWISVMYAFFPFHFKLDYDFNLCVLKDVLASFVSTSPIVSVCLCSDKTKKRIFLLYLPNLPVFTKFKVVYTTFWVIISNPTASFSKQNVASFALL